MALERAGIRIETGCRSGECGFCRTKVLAGNYFVCPEGDGRRAADKDFGYVHACAAYPLSAMKVKIPILYKRAKEWAVALQQPIFLLHSCIVCQFVCSVG